MKTKNRSNEFDELMTTLVKHNIVAYVRNCEVGMFVGSIPATFDYKFQAALMWTKSPHQSRREETQTDGDTPTEALKNVIKKAGLEERISHNAEE